MLEKLALNKNNLGNQLYMFCFSLYLIVNFMAGTTLSRALGLGTIVILLRLSQLAAFLVFCKIIIFDRHKFNTILAILVGACFLFIVCKQAHELDPFFMYLFIVGAYRIDFKQILNKYILVVLSMLLLVYAAAVLGLVPNNIMWREGVGVVRAGLGLATPSDLAAHVFYLMLAFALVRDFIFSRQEIGFMALIAVLIFAITNSRLDALLMLLLLITMYFRGYIFKAVKYIGFKGTALLVALYALSNLLLTYFFDPYDPVFAQLDALLSRRLLFGNMAFEKYPIHLFGQYIYQNGNGDPRGFVVYYFIDSAYVQALMMFGVIFLLFMLGLLAYLLYRAFKIRYYGLAIAVLLIALSMAVNHHFWHMSYNVSLLALLAVLPPALDTE